MQNKAKLSINILPIIIVTTVDISTWYRGIRGNFLLLSHSWHAALQWIEFWVSADATLCRKGLGSNSSVFVSTFWVTSIVKHATTWVRGKMANILSKHDIWGNRHLRREKGFQRFCPPAEGKALLEPQLLKEPTKATSWWRNESLCPRHWRCNVRYVCVDGLLFRTELLLKFYLFPPPWSPRTWYIFLIFP